MLNHIDFSIGYLVAFTMLLCGFFPIILMMVSKLKKFSGKNALQFFIAAFISTILFILGITYHLKYTIPQYYEVLTSLFLYLAAILIYLEIWGLFSRGYTLGLLLTFYKINTPITITQLASSYRGGEGLNWLMKHRFKGLIAAKLIRINQETLILTKQGIIVAYLYEWAVLFFGLKQTG